jgi:hypothetical protein
MNPFLFKAHPLLSATIGLFADPAGHELSAVALLLLFYLGANLVWAIALALILREAAELQPRPLVLYGMAFPALIAYLPITLTVLQDVLSHTFSLAERFIPVFALAIACSMLGALYGLMFRYPRSGRPIGLKAGFAVSLAMLLATLSLGFALLKSDLLSVVL